MNYIYMDKEKLQKIKEYPLGDDDIQGILEPDTEIFTYPELYDKNHIDEVFDDKGRAIMLYLTDNPQTGHWVGIIKKGNTIEMYDPYAYKPDTQPAKLNTPKELNTSQGQNYPKFTEMVKGAGYNLIYNKKRRQPVKSNINTCGRHTLTRLLLHNLSLKEYNTFMDKVKKEDGINTDDLVTAFTYNFIKK